MVEISILAIAGIALAAMFFGYGFGLFEGRSQGYKKRRKEEATEKENKPEPEPQQVTVKVDDPGLLRIKNESGYLSLDLDGSRVDTSALTAEERKRLIEMLNLMRPWLEGRPAAVPVRTSPPSPSQLKPSPELDRLDQVGSQLEHKEPRVDPSPFRSEEAARPSAPQQPTPQPSAQRSRTIAKEDRPIAPAGSIVSQIDSILQARLEGTPLDDRGIFLAQSPEGGVMVYIGLTKYMGIEDVPDPEIKAAIRSAITEWENKYTPGL